MLEVSHSNRRRMTGALISSGQYLAPLNTTVLRGDHDAPAGKEVLHSRTVDVMDDNSGDAGMTPIRPLRRGIQRLSQSSTSKTEPSSV